jgi:DNA-binding CsgD family transcriptional regulator/PAS domain-containing protein
MSHAAAPAIGKPAELINLIYEGAADLSRWQAFLMAYLEVVGGRLAGLLLSAGNRNGVPRFRWSGPPDGYPDADRCTAGDFYRSVGESKPEGVIWRIDLLRPAETGAPSTPQPKYPPRAIRYGLGGVFLRTADGPSIIVAMRPEQDGPFGERALAIAGTLMPHLRQAVLLQSDLSSLRLRLAGLTAYVDRSAFPFLVSDAHGRVLYANAAADEIAGLNDGIAITSGRLAVMSPTNEAAFLKTIEEVATGRGAPFCRFDVARPSRRPPYRLLLIMAVPSSAAIPLDLCQSAAAILIVNTEAGRELDPGILGQLFSLTPAEARVTAKLGVGLSAEEIAAQMGLSLETVRTYIRHILSKTGTGRQGELIALVLRTVPFLRL